MKKFLGFIKSHAVSPAQDSNYLDGVINDNCHAVSISDSNNGFVVAFGKEQAIVLSSKVYAASSVGYPC